MIVGWDGAARGILSVSDQVKPTSAEAVAAFRRLGLTPVLLTGDNGVVARRVAAEVGIDEVIAEMDQVAEGVKACRVAADFGEQLGVGMPITTEVVGVCHNGHTAQEAYRGLLRQHENTRE